MIFGILGNFPREKLNTKRQNDCLGSEVTASSIQASDSSLGKYFSHLVEELKVVKPIVIYVRSEETFVRSAD